MRQEKLVTIYQVELDIPHALISKTNEYQLQLFTIVYDRSEQEENMGVLKGRLFERQKQKKLE